LHNNGSNNPIGINTNIDSIDFYPYFYVKDLLSFFFLITFFSFFLFFYPNILGHPDNYIVANSLVTPPHIVPEWYFLPFYAILRSIPDKLGGVVAMVSAILGLMLLPIINTSKIRSSEFRPIFSFFYWLLFMDFILLGWIGQKPVESPYIEIGMLSTLFYFTFLILLIPILGLIENFLLHYKFNWKEFFLFYYNIIWKKFNPRDWNWRFFVNLLLDFLIIYYLLVNSCHSCFFDEQNEDIDRTMLKYGSIDLIDINYIWHSFLVLIFFAVWLRFNRLEINNPENITNFRLASFIIISLNIFLELVIICFR